MGGGTACDLSGLTPLYKDRRVNILPGVMRAESLDLLKAYFQAPGNAYLKDTLRVSHIDWMVSTHPHNDHVGGLSAALKACTVVPSCIWWNACGPAVSAWCSAD